MRLGDDDAVAAGGFATIQSQIRAFHDGVEVRIRPDHLRDPRGEGDLDGPGGKRDWGRGEPVAKLFSDVKGSADVGLGQHAGKLFAPQARDQVGAAQPGAEQVGDRAKSDIASMVAVAVIDGFEQVDVDRDDRDGPGGAAGQGNLPLRLANERAPVEDPGEGIREGGFAKIPLRLDHKEPDVQQHHREADEHAGELRDQQAGIGHRLAHSRWPVHQDDARAIESKDQLRQEGDGGDAGSRTKAPLAMPQEQPYAEDAEDEPGRQDRDHEMSWPDELEPYIQAEGAGKENPAQPAQQPANPTLRRVPQQEPAKSHVHRKKREDAEVVGDKARGPVGENSPKGAENRRKHLQSHRDGKPRYPLHSPILNGDHQQRYRIDSER